jgi:hypothetical protein
MINKKLLTQVLIKDVIGAGIRIKPIIFRINIVNCQPIINSKIILICFHSVLLIANNVKIERINCVPPNNQE